MLIAPLGWLHDAAPPEQRSRPRIVAARTPSGPDT